MLRAYFRQVSELNAQTILALTYLVIAAPIWLGARVARAPLLGPAHPIWHERAAAPPAAERLREPF